MLLAAAILGALTVSGMTTAPLLLGLTLALGLGSAFTLPAWSAMIPELVGHKDLQAAITLNGLAMNLSRAIGPALAGYIMALTSLGHCLCQRSGIRAVAAYRPVKGNIAGLGE